jgi:hypothetical protein
LEAAQGAKREAEAQMLIMNAVLQMMRAFDGAGTLPPAPSVEGAMRALVVLKGVRPWRKPG